MLALAFISFIETRHITKNMVPTRLASSKLECSPNTPRDNLLIFSLRIDFSFRPVCVTTQNWIAVLIFLRLGCETGVFANITNCAGIGVALCLKNTCLNVQLHLVCGRITKSYCWTYCIKIKLTFSGVLCSIWLVILYGQEQDPGLFCAWKRMVLAQIGRKPCLFRDIYSNMNKALHILSHIGGLQNNCCFFCSKHWQRKATNTLLNWLCLFFASWLRHWHRSLIVEKGIMFSRRWNFWSTAIFKGSSSGRPF